jgi:cell division septum initiation protein DivIVA
MICVPVFASEPIVSTNFDTGAPIGWTGTGTEIAGSEGQDRAIRLSGAGSTLISPLMSLTGTLTYFLEDVAPGDSYTLLVQASATAADGSTTWETVDTFKPSDITLPSATNVRRQISINTLDPVQIRWRLADRISGSPVLDDVTVFAMTPIDMIRAQDARTERIVRNLIREAGVSSGTDPFARYPQLYDDYFQRILAVRQHASGLAALASLTGAMDSRRAMTNPTDYPEYAAVMKEMQRVLVSPAQKSHLADLEKQIKDAMQQRTGSRLAAVGSGLVNFAVSLGSSLTGINLRSIYDGLKGLLADGFSKANLESLSKRNLFGKPADVTDELKTGDVLFKRLDTFLSDNLADRQRVDQLAARLDALEGDAASVSDAAAVALNDYFQLAGATPDQVMTLLRTPSNIATRSVVVQLASDKIRGVSATRTATSGLTLEQAEFARQMERLFRTTEDLEARYRRVSEDGAQFIVAFADDLNKAAPYKDQASADEWQKRRSDVCDKLSVAVRHFPTGFMTHVPASLQAAQCK